MRTRTIRRAAVCVAAVAALAYADDNKALLDQKIEILRGLNAEYATVKAPLPRSRKPLDFESDGTWSQEKWDEAGKKLGPAARLGDLVQVTAVKIEKDAVILELNDGMKSRTKWYDRIQVSGGVGMSRPTSQNTATAAPGGTSIAIRFKGGIGDVSAADIKKILKPVLDFEQRSASEQYFETLPPEIKTAIAEKKPVEGMDRDQVLLALGRPLRKTRETNAEGDEIEDWIYGEPPGRVTFVTFSGQKVIKVKDTYAGLGGSIAETPKPPL